jgi:hypothetical protein
VGLKSKNVGAALCAKLLVRHSIRVLHENYPKKCKKLSKHLSHLLNCQNCKLNNALIVQNHTCQKPKLKFSELRFLFLIGLRIFRA